MLLFFAVESHKLLFSSNRFTPFPPGEISCRLFTSTLRFPLSTGSKDVNAPQNTKSGRFRTDRMRGVGLRPWRFLLMTKTTSLILTFSERWMHFRMYLTPIWRIVKIISASSAAWMQFFTASFRLGLGTARARSRLSLEKKPILDLATSSTSRRKSRTTFRLSGASLMRVAMQRTTVVSGTLGTPTSTGQCGSTGTRDL